MGSKTSGGSRAWQERIAKNVARTIARTERKGNTASAADTKGTKKPSISAPAATPPSSPFLKVLSASARQATKDPRTAALEFWRQAASRDTSLGDAALHYAQITDEQCEAFAALNHDVLVKTRLGHIWICPDRPQEDSDVPWVTLPELRALGRAVVDLLADTSVSLTVESEEDFMNNAFDESDHHF